MPGRVNIKGQKFGRLIALYDIGESKNGYRMWKCLCECGQSIITSAKRLKGGITKSCGCLRSENGKKWIKNIAGCGRLPAGEANFNHTFGSYKHKAKERNFEFLLTKEQFRELVQQNCFYCGAKPHNIKSGIRTNDKFIYNGIDRTDNTKGYIIDNCVTCCGDCNWMKKTYTQQEFLLRIKLIYDHMLKGRNG